MLNTTGMLYDELKEYSNPGAVIRRKAAKGELICVRHGLYETDPDTPGICLAMHIFGPSYLSFDFALSYYDLIPEGVIRYTSASFRKHKSKEYNTPFGIYTYRDVPESVYPWEIRLQSLNGYPYMIASPEKALCDKLYTISPMRNCRDMEALLFDDLRIDQSRFSELNMAKLIEIAALYHTINHRIFRSYINKEFIHGRDH